MFSLKTKHFTDAFNVRCYTSSRLRSSMLENKQEVHVSQQQKPRDSASGTTSSWTYQHLHGGQKSTKEAVKRIFINTKLTNKSGNLSL